ncbi:serine/threonine-protein phosphatase [Trinickia violacea]|uniref:Serine/threonine-protein phosphatase n=1 Tax=Trinickia violacea TaxID=2571746 RepID=A0A4P8IPA8_9BURK|nr:protein phosphatase 2C domain-containing protein [Trinickia violacea]QCP49921.1 serine/threonine-protein phosphatase [Trinickia violacea]
MLTQFNWTSASRTDVGLVRAINEDACLDLPAHGIWAVADGMGGHSAGDVASRMIVDALAAIVVPPNLADFVASARAELQRVNRTLRDEAAARRVRTIGSTVAALIASGSQCGLLWAGDSRIYLYRRAQLRQLSRDHSQVEELKAQGYLTAEEAVDHPAHHLITRAVGAADWLELDEQRVEINDGDMFLLCSDGLSNEVDETGIVSALAGGDCRQATEALVEMALQEGGRDNISAIVIRADDPYAADKTLVNPALP